MADGQSRAMWLLIRSALTGALGGLLFGFDTAVIAGTTHALQLHYALSEGQKGFTVAIALYGTVLGAMLAGPLGQRIGSRTALRWMGFLYVISAAGCALAGSWPTLLAFRALGGLGIGGSSVLGPVYIAELAPAKWRGRLVGLFQINIVIGILLAYLSNAIVAHLVPALNMQWRWQFGVGVLPALLFLLLLLSVPQSSRWLVSQSRFDEAQRILFRMGSPDSEAELRDIMDSIHMERGMAPEPETVKANGREEEPPRASMVSAPGVSFNDWKDTPAPGLKLMLLGIMTTKLSVGVAKRWSKARLPE